jgi:O-antigen/teichoic acid export membrane protein
MVATDDLSKLVSSAGLVLLGGVLGSVVKLVERIAIARSLSVDAYGEVSIGIALMSIGAVVGLAGFQQGIPRYMSRFDDERDVRGAWITGLSVTLVGSVLLTAVVVVYGDVVVSILFEREEAGLLVLLFAVAIPFNVGLRIGVGAIRGMENTIYKTYGKDIFYFGFRILVLVALLLAGAGTVAAGWAYLIASAAGFVVVHLLLRRLVPLVGEFTLRPREMARFSAPLLVSTVVGLLLSRTDTLMLGYFRPSNEVAMYTAAYPLATGMLVVLSSFGFMYLPVASRLDSNDEREEVDATYKVTTKWIYIVTFPVFLTFVAFPRDVLSVVFGNRYVGAALALQILAIGFFTNAAGGRNRETLAALGYTEYVLLTNAIALTLNIALNLVLIPAYGYVGASVASAASFACFNAVVILLLYYKFGISPFSRWSTRAFVVLPTLLVPPAVTLSEVVSLSLLTLPLFAVGAAVVTVYTAAVTGCLQAEDRIPMELVESWTGVTVPLVRRFVPDGDREDGEPISR